MLAFESASTFTGAADPGGEVVPQAGMAPVQGGSVQAGGAEPVDGMTRMLLRVPLIAGWLLPRIFIQPDEIDQVQIAGSRLSATRPCSNLATSWGGGEPQPKL
jgi:hypothetical protein